MGEVRGGLTVVFNHGLDVTHDLSIAPVSILGHLCDALPEDTIGLGIEDERHSEKTLDPF